MTRYSWHDSIRTHETLKVAAIAEFRAEEFIHADETTLEGEQKGEFIKALINHVSRITDEEELENIANEFDELPELVRKWFYAAVAAWSRSKGGKLDG